MKKTIDDVILLPGKAGTWVAINVFTRTCLGLSIESVEVLTRLSAQPFHAVVDAFAHSALGYYDIQIFSNYAGLFEDPSRYIRDHAQWPPIQKCDIHTFLEKCAAHFIIIDDEMQYAQRFSEKKNILDKYHLGNFHEQLGQVLLVEKREDPEKWWLQQKFTKDGLSIRNDLYYAAQGKFLENFFKTKFNKNATVLDIGCGIGHYSKRMALAGAKVTGLDPNKNYIDIANSQPTSGVHFKHTPIGRSGDLDFIPSASFDFIFMCDTLLFYEVPIDKTTPYDIQIILNDVKRILKPTGVFINVEPHPTFWLSPWLGSVTRPYTVVSEYMHKNYGVTWNVSRLIKAYTQAGFAISHMDELVPDASFADIDPRAYHFATQFPLWHLFELRVIPL